MTIPKETLKKWKDLYSTGDAQKMADRHEGGYPNLFHRALDLGRCKPEVFKTMADFYEEKLETIKEYL